MTREFRIPSHLAIFGKAEEHLGSLSGRREEVQVTARPTTQHQRRTHQRTRDNSERVSVGGVWCA